MSLPIFTLHAGFAKVFEAAKEGEGEGEGERKKGRERRKEGRKEKERATPKATFSVTEPRGPVTFSFFSFPFFSLLSLSLSRSPSLFLGSCPPLWGGARPNK